ncbi:hypothetical protein EVAR_102162_1 [Eumeta japonica]|uniref:Uncharacterized protein n=1 Tax=Eumeta variegata TaxID=151549 RepID=A0A4C1SH72_EUMVA|nr:hypothetical protein EVAR_102162_1 [Eumeta japonica]
MQVQRGGVVRGGRLLQDDAVRDAAQLRSASFRRHRRRRRLLAALTDIRLMRHRENNYETGALLLGVNIIEHKIRTSPSRARPTWRRSLFKPQTKSWAAEKFRHSL